MSNLRHIFGHWLWLGFLFLLPFHALAQDTVPDRLLYMDEHRHTQKLFIANVDGSDARPLDDRNNYEGFPLVSPDGQSIAYLGQDENGGSNVFVMDADGANPRRVTDLERCIVSPTGYAWSPDSTKLAVSFCNQDGGSGVIIIGLDGTVEQTLSVTRAGVISSLGGWTPDGSQLIINGNTPSSSTGFAISTIFSFNLNSSTLRQLTSNDQVIDARLSPDGTQIAYVQIVDRQAKNLFVIDVDGSDARQIPLDDPKITGLRLPAWSPDGRRIAFTGFRGGSSVDVLYVNADGTGLTRVTNYDGASAPDWLPATAEATATP